MKKLFTERFQELAGIRPLYQIKKETKFNALNNSNKIFESIFDKVSDFVKGKSDKEAAAIAVLKKGGIEVGKPFYNFTYGGGTGQDGKVSNWMVDYATPEELKTLKVPVPVGFTGDTNKNGDTILKNIFQEIIENEEGNIIAKAFVSKYSFVTGKFIDDNEPDSINLENADEIEKALNPKDGETFLYTKGIEMVPYVGSIWEKQN